MSRDREGKRRVRTARGRSVQSTRWLERQINDPYVHKARREGLRARSAYKLQEIDAKAGLLKRGALVVDLGAAPGSWSQLASRRGCRVVGCDLETVEPVDGATFIQGDFREPETQAAIREALGGPADLLLSDLAATATGQRTVDRLRAEELGELVLEFAETTLRPGASALIKLVRGAEASLRGRTLELFRSASFLRPPATRKESSELFLLAREFRGTDA